MTQQRRLAFPIAAFCAVALTLLSSAPAVAETCGDPLDVVVARYEAAGSDPVMLGPDELHAAMTEFNLSDVSRGFYVEIEAHVLLGLEVEGCLLPPIEMTQPLTPTRLSGATAFGIYA